MSCKSLNSSSFCTTQVSQQVIHVHQCPVNLSSIPLPVSPSKSAGYTCIPVSCKFLIDSSTCTTQVGQMVPVLHKQQCPVNLSSVPLTVQPRVSQKVIHVHQCPVNLSSIPLPVQTSKSAGYTCIPVSCKSLINSSTCTTQVGQMVPVLHKQQCPVNLSSVTLTVQPRVSQQVTHVHKCLISSSTSITIVHQCPVNLLLPLVNCSIFTAQFS